MRASASVEITPCQRTGPKPGDARVWARGWHELAAGARVHYSRPVLPWETIAEARAPDGARVILSRRGDEYLIRVGGWDLMSSRDDDSARALASVGLELLGERREARVLIGGLGMGYSLAEALERVGPEARVEVAELLPAIVEWNRGPLAELAGRPLEDPRVRVHVGDVRELIAKAEPGRWDAILLDVDNGPDPLAHDHNAGLYGPRGLAEAHRALRPGGVHAVWSYSDAGGFARVLERAGFRAAVHRVDNRGRDRGRKHAIWTGLRGPDGPRSEHASSARPAAQAGKGRRRGGGKGRK